MAGLLLLDDKSSFRNNGFYTIEDGSELFQNLIFFAVLIANAIFLSVWSYTFIGVQVRIHFSFIKKFLGVINISLDKEVQGYETNLSSYLKKEESSLLLKSHSKMRVGDKGSLKDDDMPFKSSLSK